MRLRTGYSLPSILLSFLVPEDLLRGQDQSKVLDLNRHGWFSYSGDHQVRGRWGVHFDGQWRRAEVISNWQQFQLRPGLNYQLAPNVLFTLGYAYTRTYPYGEFPARAAFPEHRIYQQFLVRQQRPGLRLQHRVRLEQRFIKYSTSNPPAWTYQNRFRYMARVEIPLAKTSDDRVSWYLPISNEILLGIPPNFGARTFDQNRAFIGIGRSAGRTNFEIGYMNQLLGQRNGRVFEFNNTLVVSVTSSVPLTALFGD